MIQNYLPIGGLLAAFAIIVGSMFISARVPVLVKIAASALAVMFAIMIWLNATALLGYPVVEFPKQGMVISMLPDKPHGFLYLWVLDGGSGPRSYRIPFSSGEAQELMEAERQAKESGGTVRIRPRKKGHGVDGDGDEDGDGRRGHGHGGAHGHGHGSNDNSLEGDDTLDVDIDVVPLLPEKD